MGFWDAFKDWTLAVGNPTEWERQRARRNAARQVYSNDASCLDLINVSSASSYWATSLLEQPLKLQARKPAVTFSTKMKAIR